MPLSRKNVLILDLKMSASSAFWALFFALQLHDVHAKNTAFGLRKLAVACKQTAKGDKASLLETIRGTCVVLCVIKSCYWMETSLL